MLCSKYNDSFVRRGSGRKDNRGWDDGYGGRFGRGKSDDRLNARRLRAVFSQQGGRGAQGDGCLQI